MQKIPSCEADSSSANQEILLLLGKPKVHHRVYKNPPMMPVPSHIVSV